MEIDDFITSFWLNLIVAHPIYWCPHQVLKVTDVPAWSNIYRLCRIAISCEIEGKLIFCYNYWRLWPHCAWHLESSFFSLALYHNWLVHIGDISQDYLTDVASCWNVKLLFQRNFCWFYYLSTFVKELNLLNGLKWFLNKNTYKYLNHISIWTDKSWNINGPFILQPLSKKSVEKWL